MKAAVIHSYGRHGVLHVEDIPVPSIGHNEVLVKVEAASVNPRDWLLMRGVYQGKRFVEPLPATLGSDFSGTITACGANVKHFKVGDTVFGMQPLKGQFGAFAEYIKIRANAIALKPETISHADAAAIPCAGMTSYQTIHRLAQLKPSETILINGASGGVGTYGVQIAKAHGAKVVAVCSGKNIKMCKQLDADEVLDYAENNFEEYEATFDVVYDVIGRSSPRRATKCLKAGGRYVTTIPNAKTVFEATKSWVASLIMPGKHKRTQLIVVKPVPEDLTAIADLIGCGKITSVIDSIYTLDDIQSAFDHSQSWRAKGKIVIDVSGQLQA